MEKLKPCPFCGGEVVRDEQGSHVYRCTCCGAITRLSVQSEELNACAQNGLVIGASDKWIEDADQQWNTRYERTCSIEFQSDIGDDVAFDLSCGHSCCLPKEGFPLSYCYRCGAKVVEE